MPAESMRQDRGDLVLSPSTFAFVLDGNSGTVKIHVGPVLYTPSGTDKLVLWNGKRFTDAPDYNQARQSFLRAEEGQYVVLFDPVAGEGNEEDHPMEGVSVSRTLDVGKRIVIRGPTSFALWPGQSAEVIDGHHLNLNQYLVAQVYDPAAAMDSEERQIAEPSEEGDTGAAPQRYKLGQRLIYKGTETSFFVPQTGIEVVPESGEGNKRRFVREAATLEQLEYCVLRDESGNKRYERGPKVVFPEPTERFVIEKGEMKYRAIELNAQSGLYVKAVADYVNDGERSLKVWRGDAVVDVAPKAEIKEGDELFITGADTAIYFPRAEASVIHYEQQRKHHAIAIPTGEGRYVLDRVKGDVHSVLGPAMFLPDPRTEVVVRRVLDPPTVSLWYPDNIEAMNVNIGLIEEKRKGGADVYVAASAASMEESGSLARSHPLVQASNVSGEVLAGEQMRRKAEYTPPRTVTLNTKYLGVPRISPYAGYAVLVMDPVGNRRVVKGPADVLMDYHETLMPFKLSTGTPKTDDALKTDVYLRTVNNAVSDSVIVETEDLVPVMLVLSLRVNFEGETDEERLRWFAVENYVKLLTDHVRSLLRNVAKQYGIRRFNAETTGIIRDALLGKVEDDVPRPGRTFEENGMRLYDVEVLESRILHPRVGELLEGATMRALQGTVELTEAKAASQRHAEMQAIERDLIDENEATAVRRAEALEEEEERRSTLALKQVAAMIAETTKNAEHAALARAEDKAGADLSRELRAEMDAVELARDTKETDLFKERMSAMSQQLIQAMNVFGDRAVAGQMIEALGPAAMAAGLPTLDFATRAFKGTALEGVFTTLSERPMLNGRETAEEPAGR